MSEPVKNKGGRPPGSTTSEMAIKRAIEKATPTAVEAMAQLAAGVWYEDPVKGRVYRTKPDKGAAQWILEQRIGKATERSEVVQTTATVSVTLTQAEAQERLMTLIQAARERMGTSALPSPEEPMEDEQE